MRGVAIVRLQQPTLYLASRSGAACANLVRKRPTFTNSFESRFQALFVPLWINHAHVVLAKLRCAVQVAR